MTQKIIAVDIDEVLTPFVEGLVEYYNRTYHQRFVYDDYHSFHFSDVWKCSDEEANEIVNDYLKSDVFKNLKPIPGSFERLKELKEHFDFKIVTSRQFSIQQLTEDFINTYYPGIFSEILLGNHYGDEGRKRSKPEMMKDINSLVLIDDNLGYVRECYDEGLKAILFGDYPWNACDEETLKKSGIKRVHTWSEVTKELLDEFHW